MRGVFVFCFVLVLFVVPIGFSTGLTGEAITTFATSQGMDITIQVTGLPTVVILTPENYTYLYNDSIFLTYSENADFVWYNLDGAGNITINTSVQLNVTSGTHTLYLYANNSQGLTVDYLTFIFNPDRHTIFYDDYSGFTKGSSIDFKDYFYEQLFDVNNLILQNIDYGKIEFSESIDVITDSNITDNLTNIDDNIKIQSNWISLNSIELPNFNKSARIYLYNLSFTTPRVLLGGVTCPTTVCTPISYNQPLGLLIFDVTHFSNYSAEETPVEDSDHSDDPGGGGSGGGDITSPEDDNQGEETSEMNFYIDEDFFELELIKGTYYRKTINVINNGTKEVTVAIVIEGLQKFIFPDINSFVLSPGESKEINFDVYASYSKPADVYLGKVYFSSAEGNHFTRVILNVKETNALFDIKTELLKDNFFKGETVTANVSLINLGDSENLDIKLEYQIMDFDKNIYASKEIGLTISRFFEGEFFLDIQKEMSSGEYLFYSKVIYGDKSASSYQVFVLNKVPFSKSTTFFVMVILLLLFLIFFFGKRLFKKDELSAEEKLKQEKENRKKELAKINKEIENIDLAKEVKKNVSINKKTKKKQIKTKNNPVKLSEKEKDKNENSKQIKSQEENKISKINKEIRRIDLKEEIKKDLLEHQKNKNKKKRK